MIVYVTMHVLSVTANICSISPFTTAKNIFSRRVASHCVSQAAIKEINMVVFTIFSFIYVAFCDSSCNSFHLYYI